MRRGRGRSFRRGGGVRLIVVGCGRWKLDDCSRGGDDASLLGGVGWRQSQAGGVGGGLLDDRWIDWREYLAVTAVICLALGQHVGHDRVVRSIKPKRQPKRDKDTNKIRQQRSQKDQADELSPGTLSGRGGGGNHSRVVSNGNVIENVLPCPSSLCTWMLPWCISTTARAINRPNPTPRISWLMLFWARKKRSNRCA